MKVGPKSNDRCPYERKAEGDLRQHGEEGHGKTELET